jgi:hypothetical protein
VRYDVVRDTRPVVHGFIFRTRIEGNPGMVRCLIYVVFGSSYHLIEGFLKRTVLVRLGRRFKGNIVGWVSPAKGFRTAHASSVKLTIGRHLTCFCRVLLSANSPFGAHIRNIWGRWMAIAVNINVFQGIFLCEFKETSVRVHSSERLFRRFESLKRPKKIDYQSLITCEGEDFA